MFALKGHHRWKQLPYLTIFGRKYEITPKGSELTYSLWKAQFKVKTHQLIPSPNYKDMLDIQPIDSIQWPTLDLPQVDLQDVEEAMKLHSVGIRTWGKFWDQDKKTQLSRADLITRHNLSDTQLDIIGKMLMLWNQEVWWLMTIEDPPKLKAFQWKNQRNIWPIPPMWIAPPIHCILNQRWNIPKDRRQWYLLFKSLQGVCLKPKKACLAWFILYRAIWTQKKL